MSCFLSLPLLNSLQAENKFFSEIIFSKNSCLRKKPPPDGNFDGSIVHKIYAFYTLLYTSIKYLPKKDQYTLGIRMESLALEILELTLLARTRTGSGRMLILNKVDIKLKMLKIFVRMSHEVKALSQSRYILLEEKLLEIGRMLGGWIKQLNTKPAD